MKKFFLIFLAVLALCLIILSSINLHILNTASNYISTSSGVPEDRYDAILVLGAGLRGDGSPSDMLRDRLLIAVSLYNSGLSDVLILSGDRSGESYDEVGAMKDFCIGEGVPEGNIICDNIGYSTYESIYNTKENTDFKKIIIVTQSYHLYRAIYISRQMGFDAYGVSADIHRYRGQTARDIREGFARVKDFFQVNI